MVSGCVDIVTLRVPRGAKTLSVMRVVMSGVASRLDIPLDRLDDLQLAVETLIVEEPPEGCDLVLEIRPESGGLRVRIDGLTNQSVKAALVAADPFEPCEGCLLDVRLLLDPLVDRFEVVEGEAGSFGVVIDERWA